jgi:hypothetical protein
MKECSKPFEHNTWHRYLNPGQLFASAAEGVLARWPSVEIRVVG